MEKDNSKSTNVNEETPQNEIDQRLSPKPTSDKINLQPIIDSTTMDEEIKIQQLLESYTIKRHQTFQQFYNFMERDVNRKYPYWKGYSEDDRNQRKIRRLINNIREPVKTQIKEEKQKFKNLNDLMQRIEQIQIEAQQSQKSTNQSVETIQENLPQQLSDPEMEESKVEETKNETEDLWMVSMKHPDQYSETEEDIRAEVNNTYNKIFTKESTTMKLWQKILKIEVFSGNEKENLEEFIRKISETWKSKLVTEDQKIMCILSRLNNEAATTTAKILHEKVTLEEIIETLVFNFEIPQVINFTTICNRQQKKEESFQEYSTVIQNMITEFFLTEHGYDDNFRRKQTTFFFINGLIDPYKELLRPKCMQFRNIEEAVEEAEKMKNEENVMNHRIPNQLPYRQLWHRQNNCTHNRNYLNAYNYNKRNFTTKFNYNQNQPNQNNGNFWKNKFSYNYGKRNKMVYQHKFNSRKNPRNGHIKMSKNLKKKTTSNSNESNEKTVTIA